MKILLKRTAQLLLAVALVTGTTACNDRDVATGVIIGGIIGGIAAGGGITVGTTTGYSYLSDCEGYNREWICEWSYGSSSWHRTQRRHYYAPQPPPYRPYPPGPGRPHRPHGLVESTQIAVSDDVTVDLKAQEIAKRWSLSDAASSKLSSAIEQAKGGDLKAFDQVGLDLSTLNRLLNDNKIDEAKLDKFADKLNTTQGTAISILNSLTDEYAQQKKDVNGALWKQCQSSSKWKTPEAASCSSLDAAGCSPDKGASNCLPL